MKYIVIKNNKKHLITSSQFPQRQDYQEVFTVVEDKGQGLFSCKNQQDELIEIQLPFKQPKIINPEYGRLRQEKKQLQGQLNSTDWYAARQVETGVPIPQDIRDQRQAARQRISEIRELLGESNGN